ncbi:MAG: hypothetical protein ACI82I_001665 [Gammaproteobacteria bacterium]
MAGYAVAVTRLVSAAIGESRTEHVQLASFHPQYQFEDVAANDLSHFTNRSPDPTIHLLRQDQLTKALAHVSDPEKICIDNIKTLNKLGRQEVEALCPWCSICETAMVATRRSQEVGYYEQQTCNRFNPKRAHPSRRVVRGMMESSYVNAIVAARFIGLYSRAAQRFRVIQKPS